MTAFLSERQSRLFKLLLLLEGGVAVKNTTLMESLKCSPATLTRAFREVRSLYGVQISFKKSSNTYQCLSFGTLTPEILSTMRGSVSSPEEINSSDVNVVSLKRPKKQAVSLSLPVKLVREVDRKAKKMAMTRSQYVEWLIEQSLEKEKAHH